MRTTAILSYLISEKLYETMASNAGSALRAVAEMRNTMNPTRKIHSAYLEKFGFEENDLAPLYTAVNNFQEKSTKDNARSIQAEIEKIEKTAVERLQKEKGKNVKKKLYNILYCYIENV